MNYPSDPFSQIQSMRRAHGGSFQVGDLVSVGVPNSPIMVICSLSGDGANCSWFDGSGSCCSAFIPCSSLVKSPQSVLTQRPPSVGDIVSLGLPGSPIFVVEKVDGKDAHCRWFANSEWKTALFPWTALVVQAS